MDTPKPGWAPYVVYITEISSFLHNRNIVSNGKRSLKNQISVRLEPGHLLHSSYPYPPDQTGPADKMIIFNLFRKLAMTTNDS